jgi:hypothetical protein
LSQIATGTRSASPTAELRREFSTENGDPETFLSTQEDEHQSYGSRYDGRSKERGYIRVGKRDGCLDAGTIQDIPPPVPQDLIIREVTDDSVFPDTATAYRIAAVYWEKIDPTLSLPQPPLNPLSKRQLDLKITLVRLDTLEEYSILALLDCGATGSTISQSFVSTHDIPTVALEKPIPVYNADGTSNSNGPITECVHMRMRIGNHEERIELAISHLKGHDVFLGFEWLQKHNPTVDWTKGSIEFT